MASAGHYHGRINPFASHTLGMTAVVLIAVLICLLVLAGPVALLILLYFRRQQQRQDVFHDTKYRIDIPEKAASSPMNETTALSPIRWSTQLTTSSSSSHSSNSSQYSGGGSLGRLRHKTQQHLSPLRSSLEGMGSFEFSLVYDAQQGLLNVVLRTFTDTNNAGPGTIDNLQNQLCVKLLLLPDKRDVFTTKLFRKLSISAINESFSFRGVHLNRFRLSRLNFVLLSIDRFSKKSVVGEVVLPLSELDLPSLKSETVFSKDLQPKAKKVKTVSTSPDGQILISLSLRPNENCLSVAILKAEKIRLIEDASENVVFVKVYLMNQGKQVARSKTAEHRASTSLVFNESLQMDLPSQAILTNISLRVVLLETVAKGSSLSSGGTHSLGVVEFNGQQSDPVFKEDTTAKHWNQMVETPRKQSAMWHNLKPESSP